MVCPARRSLGRLLCIAVAFTLIRGSMSGIKGLAPLLAKEAPKAIEEKTLESFQGQKIAIDASMAMYQFLIAVRAFDSKGVATTLQDSQGMDTSHLLGFFWRTIAMIKAGIKPVYVFDGKPPTLKSGEIANRNMRRAEGERRMKEAELEGDVDEMNRQSKRTLRVTREHASECKRLLTAMGVPVVDAPCEAEAQCAAMTISGVVNAVATEDMDALCCGATKLVRRLTMSEAKKAKTPIQEMCLEKVLSGLDLTMDQFVDLCLLCGSDFCETIRGMGPQTALKSIRKHGDLAGVIASINGTKFTVPEYFPYLEAREILRNPEVDKDVTVDWNIKIDEEAIIDFLVKEKGFSEQRTRGGIEQLKKFRGVTPQVRIDSFFSKKPTQTTTLDSFFTKKTDQPAAPPQAAPPLAEGAGEVKEAVGEPPEQEAAVEKETEFLFDTTSAAKPGKAKRSTTPKAGKKAASAAAKIATGVTTAAADQKAAERTAAETPAAAAEGAAQVAVKEVPDKPKRGRKRKADTGGAATGEKTPKRTKTTVALPWPRITTTAAKQAAESGASALA